MSLISNKKAHFNYEIGEKFTAGIELEGREVKSVRAGLGSLEGAYVIVRGAEAFLIGSSIPQYQSNNNPTAYDDKRPRKLLLSKKEIRTLADIESIKGESIIPLSIFAAGRNLKVDIGIGRGKKQHDKRESLKKRDTDREMRRAMG